MPRVVDQWALKKYARPSVNLDNVEVSPDELRPPCIPQRVYLPLTNNCCAEEVHGLSDRQYTPPEGARNSGSV